MHICGQVPALVYAGDFSAAELDTLYVEEYEPGDTTLLKTDVYYDSQADDYIVKLWDGRDYKIIVPATGHTFEFKEIAFSGPEGIVDGCEKERVCINKITYKLNGKETVGSVRLRK